MKTLNLNLSSLNQASVAALIPVLQSLLREIQQAIIELQKLQAVDGGSP
jgi:hypothetical protein